MADLGNLMIENARIMFRNFAGREQQFNSAGDRNFVVFLEPDKAETLREQGFNIKQLRPREEDDVPQSYMSVSVNYGKGRPPRVVLLTKRGQQRTDLGADEVEMLDYADIKNIDIVINPYAWEVNGKKGIKAYLKTAFVTINEDELELKYADMEDDQTPTQSSTANEEVDA